MDPQRLKQAYEQLQSLDERLTYRVRPRTGGGMVRPDTEQLDERLRDLATYTIELKEIVSEVVLAIATRSPGAKPPAGGSA